MDPSKFLSEIKGQKVIVKLKSGVECRGNLSSIDGFMNIVLDKSSEYMNEKLISKYNEMFIRGNSVLYISAE